jgi:hypothetical protein
MAASNQILRLAQDLGCGLTPAERLDLLIPLPASTLQVFQFMDGPLRILSGIGGGNQR